MAVAEKQFYKTKEFADVNSQTLTETFDANLQRIAKYDMDLSLPDGYDPMYGDAAYYNHQSLVLDIGNDYGNNYLKYFGSDATTGTVPFYNSVSYPEIYLRKGRLLYEYLDRDEGKRILNDIKEKYSYDKNLMREVDIILNG